MKRGPNHHKLWGNREHELIREKRVKYHVAASSSRKRGVEWTIKFEEMVFNDTCPVLGIPIDYFSEGRTDNSCAIDRKNKLFGYTLENTFVCSWRAKRLRGDGNAKEHARISKYFTDNI